MKYTSILVLLLLSLCACTQTDEPGIDSKENQSENNEQKVIGDMVSMTEYETAALKGLNAFAFDLLDAADKSGNGNFAISPLSAAQCVSMLANSVSGADLDAVLDALHVDNIDVLNSTSEKLITYFSGLEKDSWTPAGFKCRVANSFWYDSSVGMNRNYIDRLTKNYSAEVYPMSFSNDDVLNAVNNWCSRKTEGMIPYILDEVPYDNQAIWLNALYFTSQWGVPFEKQMTATADFFGATGKQQAAMMHTSRVMDYAETAGAKAVAIDLACSFKMMVILPDEGNAVTLAADTFEALTGEFAKNAYIVDLHLPKFSVSTFMSLDPALKALGVPSYVSSMESIGINHEVNLNCRQRNVTEIDEEGVKAAAVTMIGATTDNNGDKTYKRAEMNVNRPFLYVLYDGASGSILMVGRVSDL